MNSSYSSVPRALDRGVEHTRQCYHILFDDRMLDDRLSLAMGWRLALLRGDHHHVPRQVCPSQDHRRGTSFTATALQYNTNPLIPHAVRGVPVRGDRSLARSLPIPCPRRPQRGSGLRKLGVWWRLSAPSLHHRGPAPSQDDVDDPQLDAAADANLDLDVPHHVALYHDQGVFIVHLDHSDEFFGRSLSDSHIVGQWQSEPAELGTHPAR